LAEFGGLGRIRRTWQNSADLAEFGRLGRIWQTWQNSTEVTDIADIVDSIVETGW